MNVFILMLQYPAHFVYWACFYILLNNDATKIFFRYGLPVTHFTDADEELRLKAALQVH